MPRKRSRFEMQLDTLKIILKGSQKPTKIMFSANLSWGILKEILSNLLKKGLIREKTVGSSIEYSVTDKGIAILSYYDKIKRNI